MPLPVELPVAPPTSLPPVPDDEPPVPYSRTVGAQPPADAESTAPPRRKPITKIVAFRIAGRIAHSRPRGITSSPARPFAPGGAFEYGAFHVRFPRENRAPRPRGSLDHRPRGSPKCPLPRDPLRARPPRPRAR